MIDSVNNIYKRINEIKSVGKNLGTDFKPEKVKEFEEMYKESISKNTDSTAAATKTSSVVHPYLKEKTVDYADDFISNENKQLINDAVKSAAEKYNVSEDLIKAVIKVESNYDRKSISKTGAMGMMQLMPKTALEMGVEKPFDITENINGGAKYLGMMLEKYDGDLDKALSAYNAGPQRVDEVNGIPDIEETQNYVKMVKKILNK
jgi:soluble lytic murein transglycosylase-like protein